MQDPATNPKLVYPIPRQYISAGSRTRSINWLLLIPAALTVATIIFDRYLLLPGFPLLKTPPAIFAALLCGTFLLRGITSYKVAVKPERWLLLFLLGSTVSYLCTFDRSLPYACLAGYADWIQPIVLSIVLTFVARQHPTSTTLLVMCFGFSATLLLTLSGLADNSFGQSDQRVGYEGINLNRQAFILGINSIACAWLFFERPLLTGFKKPLSIVFFFAFLLGMLLTGSRTGLVAFAAGFALLVYLSGRHKLSFQVVISALVALSVAVILVMNSGTALERLSKVLTGDDLGWRDKLVAIAWQTSLKSPLVGYGPFANVILGGELGLEIIDAHNAHFQVILRVGYPVYLTWLAFMLSTSWLAYRLKSHSEARLSLAILGFMWVFSLGGSLVSSNYYWVVMSLIVGGLQSHVLQREYRSRVNAWMRQRAIHDHITSVSLVK
jgi:hypothetical protein